MLGSHAAFYLSSYVLPRDPQEKLGPNKPLNNAGEIPFGIPGINGNKHGYTSQVKIISENTTRICIVYLEGVAF